jgi:hypothetical protein
MMPAEAAAQPRDVAQGTDAQMTGADYQNYQMNDGTTYTADSAGHLSVRPAHVAAMLASGCQFSSGGLPS